MLMSALYLIIFPTLHSFCQALYLFLWERADTIITKHLEVTDTQVWYIIGIVSTESIGLIRGTT